MFFAAHDIMHEQLKKKLREASVDGRITCAVARKIAEELGVAHKDVGAAANELKIRIKDCQLGCF